MGKSREKEHRAFLTWLLDTIVTQQADTLLVVGDIFDTGTPPSYARTLYHNFIVEMRQRSTCQLIIIGGNHDSVATLHETRQLLNSLNTTVIGGITDTLSDQLIPLVEKNGETGALLCAVPYLRPRDILRSYAGESLEQKHTALLQAMETHYAELFKRAQQHTENLPIIVTGHLTTVGSILSETVRELYIGSLDAFPATSFPAADYIALGHLHRPQTVAGTDHIRYSGAPLPLSFGEASQQKQLLQVDFDSDNKPNITLIEIPCFQQLLTLSGSLQQIEEQLLQQMETTNFNNSCSGKLWLEVEVSSDGYLNDLQPRIQQMIEPWPIELLRIRRQKTAPILTETLQHLSLHELSVDDVFQRRLDQEELSDDRRQQLNQAFSSVVAQCQHPVTED